jgi:hypothetical protein
MMGRQEDQVSLMNEINISKLAKDLDMPNLINLAKISKGEDYLALVFKKY